MRTNLIMNLAVVGVSFSLVFLTSQVVKAQTWYDSEGRAVVIDGKRVSRGDIKKVSELADDRNSEVIPIIPKVLELKPELSSAKFRGVRYFPYSWKYNGYHIAYLYYKGCYQPSRPARSGVHLNYRRGNFSIRARY